MTLPRLRAAMSLPRASAALALAAFACGFAAVAPAAPACHCFAERNQCMAEAVSDLDKRFCRLEFNHCMDRFCPAPPSP